MNYIEIIVLIVSFLAIIISLFAIWLAIMFYRHYTQLSLLFVEINKSLEMTTVRLERLPALLYYKDNLITSRQNKIIESQDDPKKEKK